MGSPSVAPKSFRAQSRELPRTSRRASVRLKTPHTHKKCAFFHLFWSNLMPTSTYKMHNTYKGFLGSILMSYHHLIFPLNITTQSHLYRNQNKHKMLIHKSMLSNSILNSHCHQSSIGYNHSVYNSSYPLLCTCLAWVFPKIITVLPRSKRCFRSREFDETRNNALSLVYEMRNVIY